MLLALLVLHRAKLLASNQSVLALGVAPVQVVSHLCHCICASTAICAVASCNGFVCCLYASLHSGFVCLTASILAWSRGGSPSNIARHGCRACMHKGSARCRANKAYTALHHGEGVFGKDAEIRTHQVLHEAKPTECPKGDRD